MVRSAALVASLFAADKVLALGRDAAIARAFGASAELDAYYAAFELPDGLFTVVAGSAMATTLIPILAARLTRRDWEGAWRLISVVLNLVLLTVAAVSVLAAIFAPQVIRIVAPGFDPYRHELAVRLMRLVLLQTLISSASGIAMATLQAHQHFLLPAVAPLCYTMGRLLGALFLAPRWGIFGLAWGGILGTVCHLLVQVPGLLRYRARWWPVLSHEDLRALLALMGPRALGLGVTYLNFVLPTFLGSQLFPGAIAAYEYGWRLMQFPETIIGTALGLTVFPTLAAQASIGDRAVLRRTAAWALRLMLALTIPAGAGLVLLGHPLTMLLFQRGAFDPLATERVYGALQFFALGLIAHAALEVASRLFYAQRDMWTPLWAALVGFALNAGVGWLLLPLMAHRGLSLANSLGACVQVAILLTVAAKRLGGVEGRALGATLARTATATAAMAGAVLVVRSVLAGGPILPATLLALGAGIAVYLAAAVVLRSPEIVALPSLLTAARQPASPDPHQ